MRSKRHRYKLKCLYLRSLRSLRWCTFNNDITAQLLLTSEHEVRADDIIISAETPWGGMSLSLLNICPDKIMSKLHRI